MPSFGPIYGTYMSESGGDVAWTNPTNMEGAPQGASATATLAAAQVTATASLLFGDALALVVPPTARITSLSINVRASDSAYDGENVASFGVQLVDGVPIGVAQGASATAAALTTYTITNGWGVVFTRALIESLRVAFYMGASPSLGTNVGCDSVWLSGTYSAGGGRSRSRLTRSR